MAEHPDCRGIFMLLMLGGVCPSAAFGQMLYTVEGSRERIVRTDTTTGEAEWIAGRLLDRPSALGLDETHQCVFWADPELSSVFRTNLDGSNTRVIRWASDGSPADLALDPVHEKLYWAQDGTRIWRADYDGTGVDVYLDAVGTDVNLVSVEVDPIGQKVYWVENNSRLVRRANLDGSQKETVVAITSGYPNQLALDLRAGKLYVVVGPSNPRIVRADLDGSSVEAPTYLPATSYLGQIALDTQEGWIYWTHNTPSTLNRVRYDGTSAEVLGELTKPLAIAIDSPSRTIVASLQEAWPTICRAPLDDLSAQSVIVENPIRSPSNLIADPATAKLYFLDRNDSNEYVIRRMNLDGGHIETLLPLDDWVQFALDSLNERLYWAGSQPDRIERANLDGTNREIVIKNSLNGARALQVDLSRRRIYWADEGDGMIRSSNLDGSDVHELVRLADDAYPTVVAFDAIGDKLYWMATSPYLFDGAAGGSDVAIKYRTAVFRADPDGGNVEGLGLTPLSLPAGVAVDAAHGKIYWSEHIRIMRINLDGTGQEVFEVTPPLAQAPTGLAIAVGAGKIYWAQRVVGTSTNQRGIFRANLDGSDAEMVVNTGPYDPQHVAVDEANGRIFYTLNKESVGQLWATDLQGADTHEIAEATGVYSGVAYDPTEDRVYWSVIGTDRDTLEAARSDGSDAAVVLREEYGAIGGLAVDPAANLLFWSDKEHRPYSIYKATLNGTSQSSFVSSGNVGTGRLRAHHSTQQLFWWEHEALIRSDYDGTDVRPIVFVESYYDLRHELDQRADKIYWQRWNVIRRANLDGSEIEDVYEGGAEEHTVSPMPHVTSGSPMHCRIDSRQPHELNDAAARLGWTAVDLSFSGELVAGDLLDLEATEVGGDGIAPVIQSVDIVSPPVVRATSADPIEPGAWTCIGHINSGTRTCVGYLPGDVNGDGSSSPVDVLRLIDALNGVADPPLGIWQTDTNRSGTAEPADVLRLIDLLNGAQAFDVWNGRTIGACPSFGPVH